jgi:hypothetical protein
MMEHIKKHWWETIFICLLILGFVSGIAGFIETNETKHNFGDSLYETFRLFDREYHSDEDFLFKAKVKSASRI